MFDVKRGDLIEFIVGDENWTSTGLVSDHYFEPDLDEEVFVVTGEDLFYWIPRQCIVKNFNLEGDNNGSASLV